MGALGWPLLQAPSVSCSCFWGQLGQSHYCGQANCCGWNSAPADFALSFLEKVESSSGLGFVDLSLDCCLRDTGQLL